MTPEQAKALAGSYYSDFNTFAKRNTEIDAARAKAADHNKDQASQAGAKNTLKQNDRPGIAGLSEGGQDPDVIRTRNPHNYNADEQISVGREDYADQLMEDREGLRGAGALLDPPAEIRDKYPNIDPKVLTHMYSDIYGYLGDAFRTARQGIQLRNSMGDVPDSMSYLSDDGEPEPTTAGIPKDTAAHMMLRPKNKISPDSESIDKGELHIPTWDEIRKSIANRDTAEALGYNNYDNVGEIGNIIAREALPGAIQAQANERRRIVDEQADGMRGAEQAVEENPVLAPENTVSESTAYNWDEIHPQNKPANTHRYPGDNLSDASLKNALIDMIRQNVRLQQRLVEPMSTNIAQQNYEDAASPKRRDE